MDTSLQKGSQTYLVGLGDIYTKAYLEDAPDLIIDTTQSLTGYTADGTAVITLSDAQVTTGDFSVYCVTNASGDGVTFTPSAGTVNLSAFSTGLVKTNVYPTTGTTTMNFFVRQGANYMKFTKSVTPNQWNSVLLDLTAPTATSGTVSLSAVTAIDSQVIASGNDFFLDEIVAFTTIDHVGQEQNVRVACLNDLSIDQKDKVAEVRCSNNQLLDEFIVDTTITIKSKVQDFAPDAVGLLMGGSITTNNVTSLIQGESFSVPSSAPYTYTLAKASTVRIGEGFGVFVYRQNGVMLRETPDPTVIKPGYYYINPTTGVLTFNAADAGSPLFVDYNVYITGKAITLSVNRDLLDFSLQFQVLSSNNKTVLWYFKRCKSSSFAIAPSKDKLWTWDLNADVLADENTGEYYEYHVNEQ